MTARPGEWHLLGHDSDPVPGSSYEVAAEGRHYSQVATTIAGQISRLRALAEPDAALVGHYAEGLRESCDELAGHLEQIEGRFRTTGSTLVGYAEDLEDARTKTMQALNDAEEAKRQLDANTPLEPDPGLADAPKAQRDAAREAAEARAGRHSQAEGALADAKASCRTAMSAFDERAEEVATRIRDASDDDMKDSRWDRFKDVIGKVADRLDFVADVLGWIAVGLTIAALFVPGLNLLAVAAFILLGSLTIHTVLAMTGNGSWLDVAFDVLGIATLGIGTTAVAAARVGRAATLAAAGRAAGRQASAQVLSRASFNGGRGLIGGAHQFLLRNFSTTVRQGMCSAYDDALRGFVNRPLPGSTMREGLKAGLDRDLASLIKDHRLLVRELGDAAIDPAYTRNLQRALTATWTGVGADLGTKLMQPGVGSAWYPYTFPPYGKASDALTFTIGGPL